MNEQEVELIKKNAKAEELIKVVQKETEKVKFEKDKGTYFKCYETIIKKNNTTFVSSCGRRRQS